MKLQNFLVFVSISCSRAWEDNDVQLTVETNFVLQTTSQKFISVTIDSNVSQAKWGNLDFGSKKVQAMAKALSPCYLRMGGTKADFLIFSPNDSSTVLPTEGDVYSVGDGFAFQDTLYQDAFDLEKKKNFTNFTMTGSMWDEINHFVTKVDWDFIFGLNVFLRKDGAWDPDNAKLLLKYTADKGYNLAGWELGNEPDDFRGFKVNISGAQLAKDYGVLKRLLARMPGSENFQILGPSVTQLIHLRSEQYFTEFLRDGGGSIVTAPTFHHYYVNGRETNMMQFISPTILDSLAIQINISNEIVSKYAPGKKVWLGETSSAWGGGAVGLSDRYIAGFMWLDKLGVSASYGIDVVCRQAFYGANYALIDYDTLEPNPDYWLSVLFKRLVGTKVLQVKTSDETGKLRAYAHCSTNKFPNGSVTVYIMNLNLDRHINVTSGLFQDHDLLWYLLHPTDSILDKGVKLNNYELHMSGDSLPNLNIPDKRRGSIDWPPLTFGFVVIPDAKALACM